jgi:hypothetical protein
MSSCFQKSPQMKKIIFGIILFNSLTVQSQNIEIVGGLHKNRFFDTEKNEGHFKSSYISGGGYGIGFGIDSVKMDRLTLRFTVGYSHYKGEIIVSDGGLGKGYGVNTFVDKSILSLGAFPINFKIIKRIDLNFGFELSGLIGEKVNGLREDWIWNEGGTIKDLKQLYGIYSSKTTFGLVGRIAYDFNVTDKLAISPQYTYYFGLSSEFAHFPEMTKSMRHAFSIGLQRKLK